MSIQLTVHFNERVLALTPGVSTVEVKDIAAEFSGLKEYFNYLQEKYGDVTLIKQIPSAVWGDTLRTNKRTGRTVRIHDMSQLFTVKFSQFVPIDSIIQNLEQLPEVKYAHQAIQVVSFADPDDPRFQNGEQWNLEQVNAAAAWDITQGNPDIAVGIIEFAGVKRDHEDFANEDGSSQFVAGKGDVTYDPGNDHGTMVSGVVAAATDNSKGIASLGRNVRMIPYRWDGQNNASTNLPAVIDRAVSEGVNILNCSFGTAREDFECDSGNKLCLFSFDYTSVRLAIENAINSPQEVVVVAATGNGSLNAGLRNYCIPDCDVFPYEPYPAAYPGVIGVSGTDRNDNFVNGWNHGTSGVIDFVAPADDILSTTTQSSVYRTEDGTSFSAPLVAALAGLILSVNPSQSPSDVENIITSTAVDIAAAGYDDSTGYGRINAYAAVLKALDDLPNRTSNSSLATAHNSGRRLVRDSSGNYHLVYQAGNQVFYAKYSSSGSWSSDIRISDALGEYGYPSIAERSGNVYVTWQRNTGSSHDIYFHKSTDGGTTWPTANRQVIASNVGSSDPLPVIASPSANNLVVVYRSGSTLASKHSADDGSSWPTTKTISGPSFAATGNIAEKAYRVAVPAQNLGFALGSESITTTVKVEGLGSHCRSVRQFRAYLRLQG